MRIVGALIVSAVSFCAPGASATAAELGGEVTVATDYVFRGVSQTMSEPALQAGLEAERDNGWYGWAWVSNVDFVPPGDPDDGANLELDLGIGYGRDIGDAIFVSVEGVAYLFPGAKSAYDYEYTEWLAGIEFRERHRLTFGYSRNVFNVGGIGRSYAAGSTLDLGLKIRLDIELGYYDLSDALDASYAYAETSLEYDSGALQWRLSYVTTDERAEELFHASTVHNRLVAAVSVAF